MKKTVCELFAGVGGFRLGLERTKAKWETVWFSQWEPEKTKQWAHACYVSHWGDAGFDTGIDISLVDKSTVPAHNLLVGGFPCQDYSVAHTLASSNGLEGKKGVLWWQIRDMLLAKKAPFVLLENVDRLLKSPAAQRGRDFGVILACFAALDYSVEWRVVNAADYGGPQRRRRTFIFAYSNSTKYGKKSSGLTVGNRFQKTGFFAQAFPVASVGTIYNTTLNFQDIPSVSDKFKFDFKNTGYMTKGEIFTSDLVPQQEPPIPLKNILEHNVPEKYYLGENLQKWEYLKGAKKLNRTAKNGHEYVFSEGPIAFPDSIDLPARTMLTSESTTNRSTHVIRDPETGRLRLLTPVEAERIQGFDDNWTATDMPEKFRFFCMGNALVVPMITRMGRVLNKIFDKE